MNRSVLYVIINLVCFGVLLYFKQPFAALFLVLAIFNGLQAYSSTGQKLVTRYAGPLGTIGLYDVDGDGEKLYGLYIRLLGEPVFIDIREDTFAQERAQRARALFEKSEDLELNLKAFLESNPAFKKKRLNSIGLHSQDLEQGEVFWDPEGYTLLKGLEFQEA